MCEECESLHDRSGQLDVVMGQSIVLSEIKTEVPLENGDPAYQNFLLQRYEERIPSFSQTDKVSKFCMDAGFISVVEIGQYFMTNDNGEQFLCKGLSWIYSSKNDGSSYTKGWIQGNTKIAQRLTVNFVQNPNVNMVDFRVGNKPETFAGGTREWKVWRCVSTSRR